MKKRILALLAVLLLLGSLPLTASAADTIVTEPTGSITVKVVYNNTPLVGLKLSCYRVGDLILTEDGDLEFQRVQVRMPLNEKIASDPKGLADELWKFMQNNSHMSFSKQVETVDKNGNLTFYDCRPGVYLITQEENYSLNGKKYNNMNHFLVTVPYNGTYQVDATSKPALDVYKPTESTTPTTKPSEKLPQTGQLNWPVPALASSGMLLFALGWMLFREEEKDCYEA